MRNQSSLLQFFGSKQTVGAGSNKNKNVDAKLGKTGSVGSARLCRGGSVDTDSGERKRTKRRKVNFEDERRDVDVDASSRGQGVSVGGTNSRMRLPECFVNLADADEDGSYIMHEENRRRVRGTSSPIAVDEPKAVGPEIIVIGDSPTGALEEKNDSVMNVNDKRGKESPPPPLKDASAFLMARMRERQKSSKRERPQASAGTTTQRSAPAATSVPQGQASNGRNDVVVVDGDVGSGREMRLKSCRSKKIKVLPDQFHYGSLPPVHVGRISLEGVKEELSSSFGRDSRARTPHQDSMGTPSSSFAFHPMRLTPARPWWGRTPLEETKLGTARQCEDDMASLASFANTLTGRTRAGRRDESGASDERDIDPEFIDCELMCPGDISSLKFFTGESVAKLFGWYTGRSRAKRTGSELWTNLFRATCAKEICGNNAGVFSLRNWLQDWRENIYKLDIDGEDEDSLTSASGSEYFQSQLDTEDHLYSMSFDKNLMLISGSTGVCKTQSVYACAEELGFEIIEVNASEKRSGSNVHNLVGEAVKSQNLVDSKRCHSGKRSTKASKGAKRAKRQVVDEDDDDGAGAGDQPHRRRQLTLILFDELETVGEGEKGFSGAIQSICRSSRRPIILTSLSHRPGCLSQSISYSKIMFGRQSAQDVCLHAIMCMMSQDIRVDVEAIDLLSMVFKGDVRQLLNQLQLWMQEPLRCDLTGDDGEPGPRRACLMQDSLGGSFAVLKHVLHPSSMGSAYLHSLWPQMLYDEGFWDPASRTFRDGENLAAPTPAERVPWRSGPLGERRDTTSLDGCLAALIKATSVCDALSDNDAAFDHSEDVGASGMDFLCSEIASRCVGNVTFSEGVDFFVGDGTIRDRSFMLFNTVPEWVKSDKARSDPPSEAKIPQPISSRDAALSALRRSVCGGDKYWSRLESLEGHISNSIAEFRNDHPHSRTDWWKNAAAAARLERLSNSQGRRRAQRSMKLARLGDFGRCCIASESEDRSAPDSRVRKHGGQATGQSRETAAGVREEQPQLSEEL